ncbi:MAG TPA: hypothetical protein VJ860_15955 [Polyangia bacterium]|jgi:hypothetical protein|nr:hypothetical protein [Polyangia bacterium]
MAVTAQNILEQLRTLPAADRLRVVEQVVHDMASEVTTQRAAAPSAIWADESESDFQAFQSALERLRAADTWRSGDEPNPA